MLERMDFSLSVGRNLGLIWKASTHLRIESGVGNHISHASRVESWINVETPSPQVIGLNALSW